MIALPFLGAAAIWDLKTRTIPNWLIAVGLISAYVYAAMISLDSLGWAVGGCLVGMVTMLPFYNWKLMGGGDVKLAGLVGAGLGFPYILIALVMSMTAAAVLIPVLQSVGAVRRGDKLPFAPLLTLGAIGAYLWAGTLIDAYRGVVITG